MHALLLQILLSSLLQPPPVNDVPRTITQNGNAITSIACNANITTDALNVQSYRYVMFEVSLTRSAATSVTMQCSYSPDNASFYPVQVLLFGGGGTTTSATRVWSYTTSSTGKWAWTIPARDLYVQCTFFCVAGTSSDKLTITGRTGR